MLEARTAYVSKTFTMFLATTQANNGFFTDAIHDDFVLPYGQMKSQSTTSYNSLNLQTGPHQNEDNASLAVPLPALLPS